MNQLNLFASACYIICYNLLKEIIQNKIKYKTIIENYAERFSKIINDNLIMENNFEELNDISVYESENIGIDLSESFENSYNLFSEKINQERIAIKEIINKKRNDMIKFIKEIKGLPIPRKPDDENQYRILSFPWCFSGEILTNIKFINM